MDKLRILVADDDLSISKFVSASLKSKNYDVISANNGKSALAAAEEHPVDLIILDIGMPEMDGIEVCRRIREWSQVPIIMLSARAGEKDKVECFDGGADDYLTKPFSVNELLARIQVVLRHHGNLKADSRQASFTLGEVEVNLAKRVLTHSGTPVPVTPTEFSLLQCLLTNRGKVLTYKMILSQVWGGDYDSEKQYVTVFIGRLRKKLEPNPEKPSYILTVPGVGYYIN